MGRGYVVDPEEEAIEAEAVRITRQDSRERALDLAAHRRAAREAYWREHPTTDATYEDYLARVGGETARDG